MATLRTDETAKSKIRAFLENLYEFLRIAATEQKDPRGRSLFFPELSQSIRDAWSEFEDDFDRHREFDKVDGVSDLDLRLCGLTGKQLDAKLAVIAHHRRHYLRLGGPKWLKRLIDAFDTLLESILKATGIAESIKELKDMLSDAADDESSA